MFVNPFFIKNYDAKYWTIQLTSEICMLWWISNIVEHERVEEYRYMLNFREKSQVNLMDLYCFNWNSGYYLHVTQNLGWKNGCMQCWFLERSRFNWKILFDEIQLLYCSRSGDNFMKLINAQLQLPLIMLHSHQSWKSTEVPLIFFSFAVNSAHTFILFARETTFFGLFFLIGYLMTVLLMQWTRVYLTGS